MSDIDLPLWNKEETDVLPEYQMTYGHVLCQGQMDEDVVSRLARTLGLPVRRRVGSVAANQFPTDPSGQHRTLGTLKDAHLLVLALGDYSAVFGPHVLFFHNRDWITWNKKRPGLMALATRQDILDTSYRVFHDGRYQLSAWLDNEKLSFPETPGIEVYVNREPIFRSSSNEVQDVKGIVAMLQCDVELREAGANVSFKNRFRNEDVPPDYVMHYVFAE